MPSSGSFQPGLEVVEHRALQRPRVRVLGEPHVTGLVQRVEHLAVHVELELAVGGVADPHRRRSLVARQPADLVLAEAALAGGAVHDLQLRGIAGDRAQQPVAERARLVGVARAHQRVDRERRVAQPAVAVVPVADAADATRASEVVGAATIPPLGAKVSAFSVMRERCTRSRQSPVVGASCAVQSSQNVVVRATASCGVDPGGADRVYDAYPVSTNGTRSPALDRELGPCRKSRAFDVHRRGQAQRRRDRR